MPRPKADPARGDTRDRILEAAQHLVQTESYDGFSFRDVAEAVGIRKASVYHHFESKEALAAAMAERATERFRDWTMAQSARPPEARLRAYCFELYGDYLCAGERLCPGASLVSGWSHLSSDVHRAVHGLLDQHLAFLTQAFADGVAAGTLVTPAGRDVGEAARWFAAAVQGALVWSRADGSRESFEALCRTTLALVEPA